jgi:UDP-3-O-acyl N-acetylglucosamine deacetylase
MQRTIARPAKVEGTGFLTGTRVRLRFVPALPWTGVVFVRTDLRYRPRIPARVENVTGTQRRTTLGRAPAQVALVEHVLAALAGMKIDNCIVELNAPEPPGLDGSAKEFAAALGDAGLLVQACHRPCYAVNESVVIAAAGATLALHPSADNGLTLTYFLDYGLASPIGRQVWTGPVSTGLFAADLAPCRTFLLLDEAEELRRQGLGRNTTFADLLVFGPDGPIDNRLRFANEPARHKVLDLIGDLSLLAMDICGHVVAYRSGHPLNVELVRRLQRRLGVFSFPARAAA